MTDEQRRRLGVVVRQTRNERYETKMAAYRAAGVNPATWDRIESGESVKDRSLVRVLKTLWPSTSGDWQLVPGISEHIGMPMSGGSFDDPNYLAKVEEWIYELQERVVLLERTVYDQPQESDEHEQRAAATKEAGGTPAVKRVRSDRAKLARIVPRRTASQQSEPDSPDTGQPG